MTIAAGVEILGPYFLEVDYGQNLEELIFLGHFEVKDPRIVVKNFPPSRSGKIRLEIYLVGFGKSMSLRRLVLELRNLKMRPAELIEALFLALNKQDLQRQFPIVAAGTVWTDHSVEQPQRSFPEKPKKTQNNQHSDRYMPFLWGLRDQRTLNLNLLGATFEEAVNKEWQPFCRFAAVKIKPN